MKYVITKEQRFFFENNSFIEFEDLLSPGEVALLLQGIKQVLKTDPANLSPEELFLRGHDLARVEPALRKILFSPRLAQMAADLAKKRNLRYGFDQLYRGSKQSSAFCQLDQESSIRSLACALMICLTGEQGENQRLKEGVDPFAAKPGSGIFFLPSTLCSPTALQMHEGQLFLLFAWAEDRAVYVFEPKDPHTHALKKLGLVFGDRADEKHHPSILRDSHIKTL